MFTCKVDSWAFIGATAAIVAVVTAPWQRVMHCWGWVWSLFPVDISQPSCLPVAVVTNYHLIL